MYRVNYINISNGEILFSMTYDLQKNQFPLVPRAGERIVFDYKDTRYISTVYSVTHRLEKISEKEPRVIDVFLQTGVYFNG